MNKLETENLARLVDKLRVATAWSDKCNEAARESERRHEECVKIADAQVDVVGKILAEIRKVMRGEPKP